jgi:hypothetical protein
LRREAGPWRGWPAGEQFTVIPSRSALKVAAQRFQGGLGRFGANSEALSSGVRANAPAATISHTGFLVGVAVFGGGLTSRDGRLRTMGEGEGRSARVALCTRSGGVSPVSPHPRILRRSCSIGRSSRRWIWRRSVGRGLSRHTGPVTMQKEPQSPRVIPCGRTGVSSMRREPIPRIAQGWSSPGSRGRRKGASLTSRVHAQRNGRLTQGTAKPAHTTVRQSRSERERWAAEG